MKNAFSIDLEDWFCVYNLSNVIKRQDWDRCELRVYESTRRILDLLEKYKSNATFFVLGWVADRLPELIREVEKRGHEIGVHGYNHLLITRITEDEFEEDLRKALDALKRCGLRHDVIGFRAPSFTIVKTTMWALKILEKYDIKYDSSIFPVGFHPDYGIADAPVQPFKVTDRLLEFPLSCVEFFGMRFPCSGGGYFRIFPYLYTQQCVKRCNAQGQPVVFYLHPWELDPGQPRVKLPLSKRIRHYYGLGQTERKLEKLLQDFQFTTIKEVLGL